jgi:hypothetical protein
MTKQTDISFRLPQIEADRLIKMEKHYLGDKTFDFPIGGNQLRIPIVSSDKRNEFVMDANSSCIDFKKYTFGNRTRDVFVLVRVDILAGGCHVNPDETRIVGSHIHQYREGYGDKWAVPLPKGFGDTTDIVSIFQHFMNYCNIITKPIFNPSLIKHGNG